MRVALVAAMVALCQCAAPGPAAALGIGISTPTLTMSSFAPGTTATTSGTILVSGVLAPWTLKAADSGHAGHLVAGAVGCTGSEAQTANPLTLSGSGLLGTTNSAGTITVGSAPQTVASGIAADTVTVSYSLVIGRTETMRAGCVFSTTVTFTVQ
jgi:hypothetical protein